MPKTENIIEAILDAISQDIAEQEKAGQEAMKVLEMANTTQEEYIRANIKYGVSIYVSRYLGHIKSCIRKNNDAKSIIRFHAYQQNTKGQIDDGSDISVGRQTVAKILDSYAERFFN